MSLLQKVTAEDNVCGNTETVYGQVQNHTKETFNDTDYKIVFEVNKLGRTIHTGRVSVKSFPPEKTITFKYDFKIPKNLFTGTYKYSFDLYKCAAKKDNTCTHWAYIPKDMVSGTYGILCKNLPTAGLFFLLFDRNR